MSASSKQIPYFRPFNLVIGEYFKTEDDKVYPLEVEIHEESFYRVSGHLRSLLQGGMKEASEDCVGWPDVTKEMFAMFTQFTYTGGYTVLVSLPLMVVACDPAVSDEISFEGSLLRNSESPSPESIPIPWREVPADCPVPFIGSRWGLTPDGSGFAWLKPASSSIVLAGANESLMRLPSPVLSNSRFPLPIEDCCDPPTSFEPYHDYRPVSFGNATLYIFADYSILPALKALASHKLHKALCAFQLQKYIIKGIIELARFAYSLEGSGETNEDDEMDALRRLVCEFLVS
ncbi:hypothetical protein BJ878DRAFT_553276 [Calycina marina]|uniref:BTB domain-containing protein n=1 Tax=Calycina marina TaxID=1763456 RepID=A0A9P8CE30_9HELO|nr:hypothetical protein BJ878DRAFT_553276 [Calycina marina]